MHNYVISLTTQSTRRRHICLEFAKQSVAFEFFDAVTPEELHELSVRHHVALDDNTLLSAGEKACLMSHVCLWQKMLDDDIAYMAVFEDDIYLGEGADEFLNHDDWLRTNHIDFIKIETFLQKKKLGKPVIALAHSRTACKLNEYHLGTAGYILSQNAARKLLKQIQALPVEEVIHIDRLMFDKFLFEYAIIDAYQMLPALCVQEFILYPEQKSMPSVIESERQTYRGNKKKRSILQKIQGELGNAWKKTLGKLQRTYIDFK